MSFSIRRFILRQFLFIVLASILLVRPATASSLALGVFELNTYSSNGNSHDVDVTSKLGLGAGVLGYLNMDIAPLTFESGLLFANRNFKESYAGISGDINSKVFQIPFLLRWRFLPQLSLGLGINYFHAVGPLSIESGGKHYTASYESNVYSQSPWRYNKQGFGWVASIGGSLPLTSKVDLIGDVRYQAEQGSFYTPQDLIGMVGIRINDLVVWKPSENSSESTVTPRKPPEVEDDEDDVEEPDTSQEDAHEATRQLHLLERHFKKSSDSLSSHLLVDSITSGIVGVGLVGTGAALLARGDIAGTIYGASALVYGGLISGVAGTLLLFRSDERGTSSDILAMSEKTDDEKLKKVKRANAQFMSASNTSAALRFVEAGIFGIASLDLVSPALHTNRLYFIGTGVLGGLAIYRLLVKTNVELDYEKYVSEIESDEQAGFRLRPDLILGTESNGQPYFGMGLVGRF